MKITVKDLIERLQKEDETLSVYFGGLDFYRVRQVGEHVHIEFNQTVYQDDSGLVVVENH
ncbi:hypothetical protein [Winogradskyella endarachnes]|uniref:Uncharacterized protein n=1 Tax=Winogradskyella endarachnes TaxID=2681965 RepID=A0A6L6UC54_9FLAO|nr:hypothetical protein [Winogradskyella endarachnes]MUU79813.1 hypothetical protein [Winogradskyella endarachnes]